MGKVPLKKSKEFSRHIQNSKWVSENFENPKILIEILKGKREMCYSFFPNNPEKLGKVSIIDFFIT